MRVQWDVRGAFEVVRVFVETHCWWMRCVRWLVGGGAGGCWGKVRLGLVVLGQW
jgi:hypothetical protein